MNQTATVNNSLVDLKRFFTKEGESFSLADFKAEWNTLSDEEKAWFKAQSLR